MRTKGYSTKLQEFGSVTKLYWFM